MLQFIETFPSLCKPCFVNTEEKIQCQDLLNEINMSIAANGPAQENLKVWFLDYNKDASSKKLSTLIQFITAFKQLPAWSIDNKIVLKFLPDTDEKIYLQAIVCFHTILLPSVHLSKNAFFKYMNKALEIESSGFSSPSQALWSNVAKSLRSQERFFRRLIFTRINFCRFCRNFRETQEKLSPQNYVDIPYQ